LPILFVGNKIDIKQEHEMFEDKKINSEKKEILKEIKDILNEGKRFAEKHKGKFFVVSAKKNI